MTTLKRGSRGEEVKTLQKKLNLIADGIFGPLTEEAVKDFQTKNNLGVDGIVGPKTWAALGEVGSPNPKSINKIIVHYTATPENEDYTVEQIRQMHLARGFADIGYHWYIDRQGRIWKGRDESKIGAHTLGQNANSIGICYCGGCPTRDTANWMNIGKDTRNESQKAALIKCIKDVKSRYPGASVHGHNEFANKPCPGFNAKDEYKNM